MGITLHVNYWFAVLALAVLKALGWLDLSWLWVFFPVWGMVTLLCLVYAIAGLTGHRGNE